MSSPSVQDLWRCRYEKHHTTDDVLVHPHLIRCLFHRVMTENLKKEVRRHQAMFEKYVDMEAVFKARTVREFDMAFTMPVMQHKKYTETEDYYKDASCVYKMPMIRTPTLFVSSRDDPVCSPEAIPFRLCELSDYIMLAVTRFGGHLGWFEGWKAEEQWMVKACIEFFAAVLELKKRNRVDEWMG